VSVYRETRITTAGQGQLIIMLYDEAMKNLDKGLGLMKLNNTSKKKDPARIEQISAHILKAQEIITELMASLDFEEGGEIAKNLLALYSWFNQELLGGNVEKNSQRIAAVRDMISDLRGAWADIITRGAADIVDRPRNGLNIAG
jgi:flagellar protein FliS